MLNSQLFAKCGYLWPSSVFKHSPVDEFQILTVQSSLAAACEQPGFGPGDCVDFTAAIFSNVREHICNGRLRLSPAERGRAVGKTVTLTVLPTQ
jgi:hypothetical protein